MPDTTPQGIDDPRLLARWEAVPRLLIGEGELLSGLVYQASPGTTKLQLGCTSASGVLQPLVMLNRPPPAIFAAQLDLVSNYASLRDDREAEILAQTTPQTPFWASVIGLQAHRHKWTLEIAGLALSLASHVQMRFKHAFACARPVELSPQIQPMIPTPGHPSWPSGHSTEAFAIATVLQALLPQGPAYKEQLERQAARIAVNRTVAGLHYPVDSAVGRLLGTALGELFVARCGASTTPLSHRGFEGPAFQGPGGTPLDFDPRVSMTDNKSGYYMYGPATAQIPASALLGFMWAKARAEWDPLK